MIFYPLITYHFDSQMYLNFKKILHENPLLVAKELTQKTFNILK